MTNKTLEPYSWSIGGDEITKALSTHLPEREMLIEGLIPKNSITMIYADDGLGKSVLVLQIFIEGSHAYPVFGHFLVKRRLNLLYFATERPIEEPLDRLKFMTNRYKLDYKNLRISGKLQGHNVADEKNHDVMVSIIREEKLKQFGSNSLDCVCFEPLYAMLCGNLKEDDEASRIRMFITRIQAEFKCSVILTHHENRGQKDPRNPNAKRIGADYYGNKFIRAMTNGVFHIKGIPGGTKWEKEKDQYDCLHSPIILTFDRETYLSTLDLTKTPLTAKMMFNNFVNRCFVEQKEFTKDDVFSYMKTVKIDLNPNNYLKLIGSMVSSGKVINSNPSGIKGLYRVLYA